MAVWADLEEDEEPNESFSPGQAVTVIHYGPAEYISQALRSYPIAESLASYLDLTDLDHLSLTCRSLREALIQFAYQLKQYSLRCSNEIKDEEQESMDEATALYLSLEESMGNGGHTAMGYPYPSSLGLSGRSSRCARDMVGPCRRCGVVICRNCATKPPSNKLLPGRLRRLCDACVEAPLILHRAPTHFEVSKNPTTPSSSSSNRSARSGSSASSTESDVDPYNIHSVQQLPDIWLRDPCTCASVGVYLCRDCGHNLRGTDDIYQRVWKWRSRYSTHLGGGIGTGLGLGNQGQKCGRGGDCLSTWDVMAVTETECSGEVSMPGSVMSRAGTPLAGDDTRHDPGYLRQEIEGIGGKVKVKSKRLVKVGATVYEYRDERETGRYLHREAEGDVRSWCSWCSRVCPSKHEDASV